MAKEKHSAGARGYALVQARAKSAHVDRDDQEEEEAEYLRKEFYRLKVRERCRFYVFFLFIRLIV
jgi:hypothetical protein